MYRLSKKLGILLVALSLQNGTAIAQTPIILKGYGMLDAYASWALTPSLKLAVEANNLTRTVRHSQYGIGDLPRGTYADDRRYAANGLVAVALSTAFPCK